MLLKRRRGWEIPESGVTPESIYLNRRQALKTMGLGGLTLGASACFFSVDEPQRAVDADADERTFEGRHAVLYPAPRNGLYTVPERPQTGEELVTTFNNYYEFTTAKERVWELVDRFETAPWTLEVTGLVHRPQVFDVDALVREMLLEERIYRLRCVEAWAATIPWTGFPLADLLARVEPMATATHVRFETVLAPDQMPGIDANPGYPWPYFEGLTLEEATNELAFVVTGAYGKPLLRQNGAPLRLAVPWKYGYKSAKSIVRIELVDEQPATFWNTLVPNEYDFLSNVDPQVPHPRWSQATEEVLGIDGRRDTLLYNGYGEYVAHLYGSGS